MDFEKVQDIFELWLLEIPPENTVESSRSSKMSSNSRDQTQIILQRSNSGEGCHGKRRRGRPEDR